MQIPKVFIYCLFERDGLILGDKKYASQYNFSALVVVDFRQLAQTSSGKHFNIQEIK